MLKFNELPPTAETTDVDPSAIRFLAYGIGDDQQLRCINGVAEVCASMVIANTADMDEVVAIGEKIGESIEGSPDSLYPRDDAAAFVSRYDAVCSSLAQAALEPALSE